MVEEEKRLVAYVESFTHQAEIGKESLGLMSALLNPSLAHSFHTNTISHQCPYTEHANFNQIECAMNC